MLLIAPICLWFSAVALYARLVLAEGRSQRLWPLLCASIAFAWSVPGVYPRLLAVALSIVFCAKGLELVRGTVRDPRILRDPLHFLLWLVMPPEVRLADGPAAALRNRVDGLRRLRRALPKLALVLVLLDASERWPALHEHWFLATQWSLWLLYAALTALSDVATGAVMQLGLHVDEVFKAPPLARSPSDFWSRRWNLYVHGVARRHFFRRWGGQKHPLRATLAVFLASGLMHEYLVFGSLGRPAEHTGFMMTFFAIHGVAVVAELAWLQAKRKSRTRRQPALPVWLAVAFHQLWMTLTAPLFFAPMAEIFR